LVVVVVVMKLAREPHFCAPSFYCGLPLWEDFLSKRRNTGRLLK
jgi:hypothetical protein